MNCPKCSEQMEVKRKKGIQFHSCLYCDGAWLPKESLVSLYEQTLSHNEIPSISDLALESRRTSESINCPTCINLGLSVIEIHNIELDVCGSCSGVFFDMGEMESLREILKPSDREYGVGEHLATEGLVWVILALFSGG